MLLRECFWGQMPNKRWVTPIFLSLNHCFDWFREILEKKGHFWLKNGNLSFNWGPLKKRISKKTSFLHSEPSNFLWLRLWLLGTLKKYSRQIGWLFQHLAHFSSGTTNSISGRPLFRCMAFSCPLEMFTRWDREEKGTERSVAVRGVGWSGKCWHQQSGRLGLTREWISLVPHLSTNFG